MANISIKHKVTTEYTSQSFQAALTRSDNEEVITIGTIGTPQELTIVSQGLPELIKLLQAVVPSLGKHITSVTQDDASSVSTVQAKPKLDKAGGRKHTRPWSDARKQKFLDKKESLANAATTDTTVTKVLPSSGTLSLRRPKSNT